MPTGKHLSRGPKTAIIFGALMAMVLGILIANGTFAPKSEPAVTDLPETGVPAPGTALLEPEPTDTVRTGTITFDTPGLQQDTLYLVYEEPGKPALTSELIFDEHSYCNLGSGGLPCMAMSVQYSVAFGGKRAVIDGNVKGGSLLVRRLRVLEENETPRITPGSVYIPWARAEDMILGCEVKSLVQTHEGIVNIVTKEGRALVALEPVIDEVFKTANRSTAACGTVQLGTE